MKKVLIISAISVFLYSPFFANAQNALGQQAVFNIESSYDFSERTELSAELIKISPRTYWYADNAWWDALDKDSQETVNKSVDALILEFEDNIYPNLTKIFGSERNPGIDKDTRLTILLHPMKKDAGGYTNSADTYPKVQIPRSNEREMIYLNSQYINTADTKIFLAHELVHLITLNQKDEILGVSEDLWLNEARAEYAPTLLGYDSKYEGSNLQRRVRDFLNNPFVSLTEWRDTPPDYGVANLFIQYLVDHYGTNILSESLKNKNTGITSINEILKRGGFQDDFSQIFTNWSIAVLLNDCSISEKYCYRNPLLKNFRVTPLMNYLPYSGESTLSVNNSTKDWSGNWHRFVGGRGGELRLEFQTELNVAFTIYYVLEDDRGNVNVKNLTLDRNFKSAITIPNFGSKNISLTVIPIAKNRISDFAEIEPSRAFFLSASTIKAAGENTAPAQGSTQDNAQKAREKLVAELRTQILAVQLEIIRLLQQLIQLLQVQLLTG